MVDVYDVHRRCIRCGMPCYDEISQDGMMRQEPRKRRKIGFLSHQGLSSISSLHQYNRTRASSSYHLPRPPPPYHHSPHHWHTRNSRNQGLSSGPVGDQGLTYWKLKVKNTNIKIQNTKYKIPKGWRVMLMRAWAAARLVIKDWHTGSSRKNVKSKQIVKISIFEKN